MNVSVKILKTTDHPACIAHSVTPPYQNIPDVHVHSICQNTTKPYHNIYNHPLSVTALIARTSARITITTSLLTRIIHTHNY
jgi:hypothetical protein